MLHGYVYTLVEAISKIKYAGQIFQVSSGTGRGDLEGLTLIIFEMASSKILLLE